ncbi:MAG: hypothetical protein M1424_04890 [Candidatus Thermoplasmatota archaeon]|nr:hypothetical protein [Candidatus Thermoplasmatota archaeon]
MSTAIEGPPGSRAPLLIDDDIIEKAQLYFSELYNNPAILSNGELVKMFVYFVSSDLYFQCGFKGFMYLGGLYDLSNSNTGRFLNKDFSAIGSESILNLKKWLSEDADKWSRLYNLIDSTYSSRKIPKSMKIILQGENSSKGDFAIFDAFAHFYYIGIMTFDPDQTGHM